MKQDRYRVNMALLRREALLVVDWHGLVISAILWREGSATFTRLLHPAHPMGNSDVST